jgi:hypothetical protein
MLKKAAFLIIFLFYQTVGQTQKYSNEFLSIGVGARAHGMSNAVVATTQDGYSTYWNPAGLTQIQSPFQISAMHAEWFAGVAKYDYLGFIKPFNNDKKSAIGLSIIRLGIDNIPYTLNLIGADGSINYNQVSEFSAADYAINMSYARQMKKLSIGGNLKVVRRVIGSFANAWGVGADIGIQYKTGKWHLAAVGRDITTTYNAWTATLTESEKAIFARTGNDIPKSSVEITKPTLVLAAAYMTPLSSKVGLTVESDFALSTDGKRNVLISSSLASIDPRLGIELDYNKTVWLRGGIGNFQKIKDEQDPSVKKMNLQPNMGVGMKLGRLTIDYALTNIGNVAQVLYSHIFSLKLDMVKKE